MVSDDVCWFLFATLPFDGFLSEPFCSFLYICFSSSSNVPTFLPCTLLNMHGHLSPLATHFSFLRSFCLFRLFFSGDQSTLHFFLCLPDSGFDFGTSDSESISLCLLCGWIILLLTTPATLQNSSDFPEKASDFIFCHFPLHIIRSSDTELDRSWVPDSFQPEQFWTCSFLYLANLFFSFQIQFKYHLSEFSMSTRNVAFSNTCLLQAPILSLYSPGV